MKRQRYGRIVNISSGAGLGVSLTGIQAYASAKAGQIGLTRQLAHELGPFGITVNNVAPGFVRSNPTTERQWEAMGEEGQRQLVAEHRHCAASARPTTSPMPCCSSPPRPSGWITGQMLSVDGGEELPVDARGAAGGRGRPPSGRAGRALPHPERQHRPGLCADIAPRRRLGRGPADAGRARAGRDRRDRRPSRRPRRVAARRRARRPSWSTATTTCSRRTRSTAGRARPSSRRCATAASMRAVFPTTRGRCWSRSWSPRRSCGRPAGCRSTSSS